MHTKEITITASRTINLGNYNSLKVEGSCTINLEPDDMIELARSRAIEEVKV